MSGTQFSTNICIGFVADSVSHYGVLSAMFPDGTRRIMEIVEARAFGTAWCRRARCSGLRNGQFVQMDGISDSLAMTLLENGAHAASVARFKVVIS
jgi:hypothetical protein